jgi:hypothetical protein
MQQDIKTPGSHVASGICLFSLLGLLLAGQGMDAAGAPRPVKLAIMANTVGLIKVQLACVESLFVGGEATG